MEIRKQLRDIPQAPNLASEPYFQQARRLGIGGMAINLVPSVQRTIPIRFQDPEYIVSEEWGHTDSG